MHATKLPQRATEHVTDFGASLLDDRLLTATLLCDTKYLVSIETDWNVQLRKGVLELCVLALIGTGPRYGYDIVQQLGAVAPIAAAEGTVYPLLRRLRQAGWVDAYWHASQAGPPRQYYRLTGQGRAVLGAMRRDWAALVDAVSEFVSGEVSRASA